MGYQPSPKNIKEQGLFLLAYTYHSSPHQVKRLHESKKAGRTWPSLDIELLHRRRKELEPRVVTSLIQGH